MIGTFLIYLSLVISGLYLGWYFTYLYFKSDRFTKPID